MSSDKCCCVPGCRPPVDGTRKILHKFPNPETDRERFNLWLYAAEGNVLGLDDQHILKYRRVCHSHFEEKYLCRNKRISRNAVPMLNIPSPFSKNTVSSSESRALEEKESIAEPSTPIDDDILDNYEQTQYMLSNLEEQRVPKENIESTVLMERSPFCIMCLGTEMKMSQMTIEMTTTYYNLLPNHIKSDMEKMFACFECAYLLNKYRKFKAKCCKAYNMLCSFKSELFDVTSVSKEYLRSIDRKENQLESVLTRSKIEFCHSDSPNRIEMVTDKLVLNNSVTYNEECCNSQEVLQKPVDLITFYNNSSCQLKLCNKENIFTSTEVHVDNDYSIDVLETVELIEETNKDTNPSVESSKEGSELEIPHIAHEIDRAVSQIIMEIEDIKNENDNDCIILDISSVKVDAQVGDGNISKSNQRTGNESLKVIDNTQKDNSFSLKSKVFQDHVTVIRLTKADAKKELLLRKESRNYKINRHKCDLCYRGFNSMTTYQTHMKKHSLKYGTLKCDVCQQTFPNSRHLNRHNEASHTWKFICKLCPYISYGANQAKSHLLAHKGKTYICEMCGKIFRLSHSLSNHIRKVHKTEFVCDLCGSVFASTKGLYFHKDFIHKMEINEHLGPQCAECDVHFASELAWKRHLVLRSRHQVQFGCRVCGEIFHNSVTMKLHMRDFHSPTVPSSRKMIDNWPKNCNFCNKSQASQIEYRDHVINEHPTKVNSCICEHCGMIYSAPSLLALHQKKHCDVMPYSCSVCGMRTKYKGALTVHQRIHSDEYTDKFQCDLCGRSFSDKGRLVRHIKGHMGIRPYKCRKDFCHKTFINKCDEKTHYRHVHCKEPYPKGDGSRSGNRKITRKKLQVFPI